MKISFGRERGCTFSHGLNYDPSFDNLFPSNMVACLARLQVSLPLQHFYRRIPFGTINLSSTNRILLNLLSKALILILKVVLSWFSYRKCNWISFSQSLSSWNQTRLLTSASWIANNSLLPHTRTCCLLKVLHQSLPLFSCFSKGPVLHQIESTVESISYRNLLCKLHSVDVSLDRLCLPLICHMYDREYALEWMYIGSLLLDGCIICILCLYHRHHQRLKGQMWFWQVFF